MSASANNSVIRRRRGRPTRAAPIEAPTSRRRPFQKSGRPKLLQHVRDVRAFQRALDRSGRRDVMFDLLAGHLAKLIARRISVLVPEPRTLSVPIPIASRMYAGALVELVRWSADREETHTPAWVDARYHEVVWLGLRGARS